MTYKALKGLIRPLRDFKRKPSKALQALYTALQCIVRPLKGLVKPSKDLIEGFAGPYEAPVWAL